MHRRRPILSARAGLTSLVLAATACQGSPPPVRVASVRLADSALAGPLQETGIAPATLEAAARDALGRAGFRSGEGERAYRARVDVIAVRLAPPQAQGAVRVEAAVEIELEPLKGGSTARETGSGSAAVGAGGTGQAWGAALEAATREAAEGLALAFAEDAKATAQVMRDLDAQDPRVRERAARVLGERREAGAVPVLLGRLRDPDPEVVHRTVGALAQIKDPRAVGPLIDVSRNGDGAFTARVARIIGDIGGREAEGYLLTVEAGHPDPRVRRAAREALGEMRARAREARGVATGR